MLLSILGPHAPVVSTLAQMSDNEQRALEQGQASPVGLLILAAMMVVIFFLGWRLSSRIRRLNRRRAFAEEHGIDLFDTERLDAAMREAGIDVPARPPLI